VPEPTADTTAAEATPRDVDELVHLLDLEQLDRDLFRARNPAQQLRWRLYGGQVAAQAVRAASLTVPDGRMLHSLHGYFLRPGDPDRPTILHVDRDRDGRSFTARHVVARQQGDAIFSMLASFHTNPDSSRPQIGSVVQKPNIQGNIGNFSVQYTILVQVYLSGKQSNQDNTQGKKPCERNTNGSIYL
jgi:hypothetical protein